MLAKNIVSFLYLPLFIVINPPKPESRFCNNRTAVKMIMRNIVPSSYKLGQGATCVDRVTRWLEGRRYIYGLEKVNGTVRRDNYSFILY